jgi:hypothetical protein
MENALQALLNARYELSQASHDKALLLAETDWTPSITPRLATVSWKMRWQKRAILPYLWRIPLLCSDR